MTGIDGGGIDNFLLGGNDVGGDDDGADRFNDFLISVGEFDFLCLDPFEEEVGEDKTTRLLDDNDENDDDNVSSLPMLLHACAIRTNGFSFFTDEWSI